MFALSLAAPLAQALWYHTAADDDTGQFLLLVLTAGLHIAGTIMAWQKRPRSILAVWFATAVTVYYSVSQPTPDLAVAVLLPLLFGLICTWLYCRAMGFALNELPQHAFER